MTLFAPPLIPFFFFFSGFTVTRIYAQDFNGNNPPSGGAIAGGIVAGIVAICIIVAALFLYRRRQRRRSLPQYAPSAGHASTNNPHVNRVTPMSGQETVTSPLPGTSTPLSRPYNPEDPSTYPGRQKASKPSFTSSKAPPLNSRLVFTVATPPIPEVQG